MRQRVLTPHPGLSTNIGYYLSGMEEVRRQLVAAVKDIPDDLIGKPAFLGAQSPSDLIGYPEHVTRGPGDWSCSRKALGPDIRHLILAKHMLQRGAGRSNSIFCSNSPA